MNRLRLNRSCERHTTRSVACCSMQRCLREGLWSVKYTCTHKEYIVFPACSMFSLIVFHCLCYSFSSMLRECLSPQLLLAPLHVFVSFYIKASCRTSHPSRNRVSGCLNMIHMVGAKVHKGSMFMFDQMNSVVCRMFVFYVVLFPCRRCPIWWESVSAGT